MPTTKPNSASERTRQQIILAAEHLFGKHGIDAVSLRQVNVAAKQKNSSATHYHFGSKETLVKAIYDYHMQPVNERRHEMLKSIENKHGIRPLVDAMILPIVEEIESCSNGKDYIQFLSQVAGHPSVDLAEIWSSEYGSAMNETFNQLIERLPDIPPTIIGQRFGLTQSHIIHSLSDRERLIKNPSIEFGSNSALYVSNLIDCVAGSLAAPVSESTNKELEDAQRHAS